MAFEEKKKFTFVSKGLPEDTFAVVKFKGIEGISRLYEFDITLVSEDPDIDLKTVLANEATLTIFHNDKEIKRHGIIAEIEQLHEVKQYVFYRAILVPRLWQADLYHENQLFLDKSVPEIIEEILKQTGLTSQDYEFILTKKYPKSEYICQYRETDFNFISRLMEAKGIYYFFEHTEDREKIIITDTSAVHKDIEDKKICYSPPSGLVPTEEEVIKAFVCRQRMLPKKVILKDYNYRKPSLELKAEAEVDPQGRGKVYLYGEHFKTPEEGQEIAKIRAEEIRCREKIFYGESTATTLCPGFIFELADHYRDNYNQRYLIIEVEHEGSQSAVLLAGIEEELAEQEKELIYSNHFSAIPADVQFRPERKTPKPRFYGTMNAKIDAAGDGKYAEIDEWGRYKVKLPFDLSKQEGGKASHWVRMAQPYAGAGFGMHFPLHKNTEILLTFIDGDPDRPLIAGSAPNPETMTPVTSENHTKNVIKTACDNLLEMEDKEPCHILLSNCGEDSGNVFLMTCDGPKIRISSGENAIILDGDESKVILSSNGEINETASKDIEIKTNASWELEAGVPEKNLWSQVKSLISDIRKVLSGEAKKSKKSKSDVSIIAHKHNIEVTAKKKDINVTADKGNIGLNAQKKHIKIVAKQNINQQSNRHITLSAKSKCVMVSKNDTLINSKKNFKLVTKEKIFQQSGKDFSARSKRNIIFKAKEKEKLNSKKGTYINTDKDLNLNAKGQILLSGIKNLKIKSNKKLCFQCGQSQITLMPNGNIEIKGLKVKIKAITSLEQSSMKISSKAGALNEIKGALVKIN